jgi:hypothetical protein
MATLGGDEYAGANCSTVEFLRRMQGRIPDLSAWTVVFIPSHLFHPLHLCPPREISMRADHEVDALLVEIIFYPCI